MNKSTGRCPRNRSKNSHYRSRSFDRWGCLFSFLGLPVRTTVISLFFQLVCQDRLAIEHKSRNWTTPLNPLLGSSHHPALLLKWVGDKAELGWTRQLSALFPRSHSTCLHVSLTPLSQRQSKSKLRQKKPISLTHPPDWFYRSLTWPPSPRRRSSPAATRRARPLVRAHTRWSRSACTSIPVATMPQRSSTSVSWLAVSTWSAMRSPC